MSRTVALTLDLALADRFGLFSTTKPHLSLMNVVPQWATSPCLRSECGLLTLERYPALSLWPLREVFPLFFFFFFMKHQHRQLQHDNSNRNHSSSVPVWIVAGGDWRQVPLNWNLANISVLFPWVVRQQPERQVAARSVVSLFAWLLVSSIGSVGIAIEQRMTHLRPPGNVRPFLPGCVGLRV